MLKPELITEIIVLSAMVVPITQAIKKWLKAEGKTALIISACCVNPVCSLEDSINPTL